MMKRYVFISLFVLLALTTHAQTIKWMVAPEYASVTHYSNDIFKCTDHNGKVQLIDWNGKSLLSENVVDEVTEYSDGYAVVLEGDKILGFLAEANHNFQPVDGEYYATKYSFFSEGYIAVAKGSAEGKQGYLDSKGKLVLDCQYLEALPVRQGWALVTENGKDKVKPRRYKRADNWSASGMSSLKSGESFVWATSFNTNGRALAKIKGGKYVVIDTDFNVKERDAKGNKDDVNSLDYSYKPTGTEEVLAPHNDKPKEDGIRAFEDNGGFGFKDTEGGIMVPCQFADANDFYSGRAIVAMEGKYGIIELLKGRFEPNWPSENVRVYEDGAAQAQFVLSVPASLQKDKTKLSFDKGDGRYMDCSVFSVDFHAPSQIVDRKAKSCALKAKATYTDNGPELLLWEGTHPLYFDYISIGLSNPAVTSEYADENDHQTVKAVVTNNSDIAVVVSATLTVGGKTVPFKGELKPNQSKPLTATMKVDEDKQLKATVTATVDGHKCGHNSSTVSLKKI